MEFLSHTYKYLSSGGIVLLPLIATSLLMWGLIFERLRYFSTLEKNDIELHTAIKLVKSKNDASDHETGVRARIVKAIFTQRTGQPGIDKSNAQRESMRLKMGIGRNIALISVFAAVAPLFGLLGTITGMITTFDVIALFGTGNASAMAGGISEALITTQCGLVVAIPGLLMCVYINRKASTLENRIDEALVTLKRYL